MCKKDSIWNPSMCVCENVKCSKIINVKDRLPENAMCTEQNSEDKNTSIKWIVILCTQFY